ncbi:type II secretory pathway component [Rheinheimera sp. WS51]|uniref:type II secretory pathway component n=1 Tax=Rheinheimera sp. WS51 TaxID=3425886 RepID=UPI003D8F2C72
MFLKQPNKVQQPLQLNLPRQRGSALVIAVFVIVVMLALTIGIARLLISSSETVVYEVQGSRTLFAAQSGLEIALTELFPLSAATQNCSALSASQQFFTPALQGCTTAISCVSYAVAGEAPLFKVTSTASCVAGEFETQRTVQLEVR